MRTRACRDRILARRSRGCAIAIALGLSLAGAGSALGATVMVPASKDNTMYSENNDGSNGINAHLFSGLTSFNGIRRALIEFNVGAYVPSGSTITRATLTLYLSRAAGGSTGVSAQIYPLLSEWGEAASDSGEPGGVPAQAEVGDATWANTFWPSSLWSQPGGDFSPTASASITVNGVGFYSWGSTSAMVSDVQSWVTTPTSNHGWILIGDEHLARSAVRFESRDNATPQNRPVLEVQYLLPPPSVGSVPDGSNVPGTELTIQRLPGGNVKLQWGASCRPSDSDYEVYEGTLGSFQSHVPLLCSTGGATQATVAPTTGDHYYLVVSRNASLEGSYGRDSSGNERPQGPSSCLPLGAAGCP